MKRFLSLLLCLLLCLSLLPAVPAFAAGDVAINETNFPDELVRSRMKGFDTDNDGKLSAAEVKEVKRLSIDPDDGKVKTLKGIELLPELLFLSAYYGELTEIDLSKNTKLQELRVEGNQLTELDLSHNPALTFASCYGNQLTGLNISKNTKLETLMCDNNPIGSLNVSMLLKLKVLNCSGCGLTKVDVSKNTKLETLGVSHNALTKLDVSNNSKLKSLLCQKNKLTKLNIGNCPQLINLLDYSVMTDDDSERVYMTENNRLWLDTSTRLIWKPDLVLTEQPAGVTAEDGSTVNFRVATNDSTPYIQYQWQYRKSANGSWYNSSLSSAKTETLKLVATTSVNGYQYRCKVWAGGTDVTVSDAATLTVTQTQAPTISRQPKDAGSTPGSTVSFTVKTPNSGVSYQWQCRTSTSGGWFNSGLSTAKTATLQLKATASVDGYQYRCKVTNAAGTTISDVVTLAVKPGITAQPQSVTASAGDIASFTVKATGATSYQWQCRTSASGSWFNSGLSTAKTATLKIKATSSVDGYQYRCKVTNGAGSVYTEPATLTVNTGITAQPQSVTASVGETVSFTVEAEGATSYQWQCRTSASGSWFNSGLSTAKEPTLKIKATASVNGYQYRCKITNASGTVYTDVATLTVE